VVRTFEEESIEQNLFSIKQNIIIRFNNSFSIVAWQEEHGTRCPLVPGAPLSHYSRTTLPAGGHCAGRTLMSVNGRYRGASTIRIKFQIAVTTVPKLVQAYRFLHVDLRSSFGTL